jgi:hypothetical protein
MTSRLLLPLLLLSAWAAAATTTGGDLSAYEAQFDAWCAEHGRAYATPEERAARLAVFADNAAFVAAHNARANSSAPSYALALNAFADLTHDEFRAARLRRVPDGAGRQRSGPARRTGAPKPAASRRYRTRWTGGRRAPSPRSRTRAPAVSARSKSFVSRYEFGALLAGSN